MKAGLSFILLAIVCLAVYWPSPKAEFVLDDYYTVARNPLIKNPSLYQNIWTSRLFDAHPSSRYIKYGYWRPLLQSSWILDYRLFGLNAVGYKWINLLIHLLNCFLIYILFRRLLGQEALALRASFLFCVLPVQEWVVRYVTGRGDELSALFALVSLICFLKTCTLAQRVQVHPLRKGAGLLAFIFWALAALTREVALSYVLYALLIYFYFRKNSPVSNNVLAKAGIRMQGSVSRFSAYWTLIGILPCMVIWPILPKLGNILGLHVLYFASAGFCLWAAQLRSRWVILLVALFAAVSFYQGRFWTTEEALLRHTRSLEWWPHTAAAQQLLMKYDQDIAAIKEMETRSRDPIVKAMWLRRLGIVNFGHGDLSGARKYFIQALSAVPSDVDSLDALAVVSHYQGQEAESLKYLNRALAVNPFYPDTLRTLGIYYYIHKDFFRARDYLSRCLFFDPDNLQARDLLNQVVSNLSLAAL